MRRAALLCLASALMIVGCDRAADPPPPEEPNVTITLVEKPRLKIYLRRPQRRWVRTPWLQKSPPHPQPPRFEWIPLAPHTIHETPRWARPEPLPLGDLQRRFFGLPCDGQRIVFLVSRTGGMTDTIQGMKRELLRAISALWPEQQFHVVFWTAGPALELPEGMGPATDARKQAARDFVLSVIPMGANDPQDGLRAAFAARPDVIVMMGYEEFDRRIFKLVDRLSLDCQAVIHTAVLGWETERGPRTLAHLAEMAGGQHVRVDPHLLHRLGQGSWWKQPTPPLWPPIR
jgi:hypothetical protein